MSDAATQPVAASGQLRIAHVWLDEVMSHKVLAAPRTVTLGTTKKALVTIPDLGLPQNFAMLAPNAPGYELTLHAGMGGQIRAGGREMTVAELMGSTAAVPSLKLGEGFCTTPVKEGDWGVIELDKSGEHILYFQFVAAEPPLPSPPPWWQNNELMELMGPAMAFALLLAIMFLGVSYSLYDGESDLVFPGRRELMTAYLLQRPEPPLPPAPDKPAEESAAKDGVKEKVKSATKGKKGKAGGEGEKPRAEGPDPADVPVEIQTGLLSEESRQTIQKVTMNRALDDKLKRGLDRLQGNKRLAGDFGSGTGTGTGFGSDKGGTGTTRGGKPGGPGGGGSVQGDFVSQGKVDVGDTRKPKGTGGTGRGAKEVAVVGTGTATGDFSGLSKEEIDKVIQSKKGLIRACYQRELDRTRGLDGKLVVNFRIDAGGKVKSVRVVGGQSSLRNSKVESCVMRQIQNLKFPAKGGAIVNYPFLFSQG